MTTPSVSILIPNYNHAHYLRTCLDSILSQPVQPLELVVCDDGSTDNSVQILQEYASRHPHMKVLQNPANKGVNFTFNRLYELAKGTHIYSMAADDEMGEGAMEAITQALEKTPDAGQVLLRTVFRHIVDGAAPVDKMTPSWSGLEVVSPEKFRSMPKELEACLSYGITVSVAYKKDAFADAGGYLQELGPTADVYSRLYVGCKFGSVLSETVGQIHNNRGPSYGRPGALKGVETKMRCYPLALSLMRKHPAVFEPPFIQWMQHTWAAEMERDVVKHVLDGVHHSSVRYREILRVCCGNQGKAVATLLLKALGLCRNALEWWLRRSFRRASHDLFAPKVESA